MQQSQKSYVFPHFIKKFAFCDDAVA